MTREILLLPEEGVERVQQHKDFPDKGLPELPVKEHCGDIPPFPP